MSLLSLYGRHSAGAHVADGSTAIKILRTAFLAVVASAFVAACAHIAVPLPGTPVPFTLQPLAVILVGMLLGPAAGFCALAAYLCEGALGLPVFTPGGLPGVARLIGPTSGYLLAYPFAAALAGAVAPRLAGWRAVFGFAMSGTLAMLLIYTAGALWFSHALHVSFVAALSPAVLPFVLTDIVKVGIATGVAARFRSAA